MKIDSLGKEKFTAGQGEIFPCPAKNKSGGRWVYKNEESET